MGVYSVVVLAVGLFFSSHSHARSCSSDEYDKADYFSGKAGLEIIDGYGGGKNKRVILKSCEYNSYSQLFKLRIEVYWDGLYFGSNDYNIDGELTLSSSGSQVSFSKSYANKNVDNLVFGAGVAGGAVVLGILMSESK